MSTCTENDLGQENQDKQNGENDDGRPKCNRKRGAQ